MNKSLIEIFKIFFIIGIQLLGGGYVIVPLLKKYIVDERKWITDEELVDLYAISQCIPGIIAANIATITGYKIKKLQGAIAAIMGIVVPSFIIILLFAMLLSNFANLEIVQAAFKGIRTAVIVLVILTVKDLWKKSVNSIFTYILFSIILLILLFCKTSPTLVIIGAGFSAIFYSKIKGVKNA